MALQAVTKRYFWWAVDASLPAPTTSGIAFLRPRLAQSTARWVLNAQDENVATGDIDITVDSIPNNPHSEITIVHDFFPSTMQTFLANNMLATGSSTKFGARIPPVSMTFGVGNGLDEDQYAGCQLTGLSLTMGNPWYWTFTYMGSEPPVPAAVQSTITLPTIERAFRKSNLMLATLPASASPLTERDFTDLAINWVVGNYPQYDTRGDGVDGISSFALDQIGAGATFTRRYKDALQKAAFLAACGTDGVMDFALQTVCGTGTHTHEFNWRRARYTEQSVQAQDNSWLSEPLVAVGLRPLTSNTDTLYSILQYKYTVS